MQTKILIKTLSLLSLSCLAQALRKPLLLVSLDGIGASEFDKYVNKTNNSNFRKIIHSGLKADYVTPIFPTLTIPNQWSIVTGVYAETHGMVGDEFYDPDIDKHFKFMTNIDNSWFEPIWWNKSEPIWYTARKNSLKTATSFWPGSSVWTMQPDITSLNTNITFASRIDELINWFTKFRLDFACIYFIQPDYVGHYYGPDSEEYQNQIKEMDKGVGYLLNELERIKLLDEINIILISDHGMVRCNFTPIYLYNYVNSSLIDNHRSVISFVSNIYPRNDLQMDQLYTELKSVPNSTVYYKNEVPKEFHFSNNNRIAPIVLIVDEGFALLYSSTWQPYCIGSHGYDNRLESMRTIFMATGPSFQKSARMGSIDIVDIHPLMCQLLELKCESNGTAGKFKDYLLSSAVRINQNFILFILISMSLYLFKL